MTLHKLLSLGTTTYVRQNLARSLNAFFLLSSIILQSGIVANAQSKDADLVQFAKSLDPSIVTAIAQRPNRFLKDMSQYIFKLSPDGIATRAAGELKINRQSAELRSKEISKLLRYDLDGDGQLTTEEIEIQTPYLNQRTKAELVVKMYESDANTDQVLSFPEILFASQALVDQRMNRRDLHEIDVIMAFDFNADGRVDLAEVAAVMGAISSDDLTKSINQRASQSQTYSNCNAPKPQAGSETVFLSGAEGGAISTLAISGQNTPTSVGTVTIAKGEAPLYIFATTQDSIVWKFDGATERVKQLVIQPRRTSQGPGAAVAGIESSKISFIKPRSCIPRPISKQTAEAKTSMARLSHYLGKSFDHVIIDYKIKNLQVPFSKIITASANKESSPYNKIVTFSLGARSYDLSAKGMYIAGTPAKEEKLSRSRLSPIQSMMRFNPDGLIAMSPKDVYATTKVVPFTTLPKEAGLLQMLADGRLEYRQDGSYYVKKQISRFPQGLAKSHAITFILAGGLILPDNAPGHASVISEKTGECLAGSACR